MKVVRQIIVVLQQAERLSSGHTQDWDSRISGGKAHSSPPTGESFFDDALKDLDNEVRGWLGRWEARIAAAQKRPTRFDGNPNKWGDHVRNNPDYEGKSDAFVAEREGVSRELINKVRRGLRHAA